MGQTSEPISVTQAATRRFKQQTAAASRNSNRRANSAPRTGAHVTQHVFGAQGSSGPRGFASTAAATTSRQCSSMSLAASQRCSSAPRVKKAVTTKGTSAWTGTSKVQQQRQRSKLTDLSCEGHYGTDDGHGIVFATEACHRKKEACEADASAEAWCSQQETKLLKAVETARMADIRRMTELEERLDLVQRGYGKPHHYTAATPASQT